MKRKEGIGTGYLKRITVYSFFLVLSACASPGSEYFYNEIVIRNNSNATVTNVTIKVKKTQGVFSCSYIPPKSECSNKFIQRKYLGNPVHVTWVYNNRKKSTGEFLLTLPPDLNANIPFRGVLEVNKGGMINPYIEQDNKQR